MSSINFNVRFSDNVQDLKKHLAEGLNQIEVTKTSMDKLVKSIGGENVIRAAHTYAAALKEIGGEAGALAAVEKLTNAERQRGLALLDKAILKAGKDAPAAFRELRDAIKETTAASEKLPKSIDQGAGGIKTLLGGLSGLAAAAGIGFGVSQVVSFGRAILADADALQKMSDRTGISAQWLQKFQVAGDDAGNTIEQITGAVNKMQDKLAGGDQSASAALQKVGLSLNQLKGLKPEDQFVAIADAIRKIKDPAEQVNVAIDLFGKGGAEILPTLKRGFDDLKDTVVGVSDETNKALDQIGDAWERLKRQMKGFTATIIVKVIQPGNTEQTSSGLVLDTQSVGGQADAEFRKKFEEDFAQSFKDAEAQLARKGGGFHFDQLPGAAKPSDVDLLLQEESIRKQIALGEKQAQQAKERQQAQEEIARIIGKVQQDGIRAENERLKLVEAVQKVEQRDALGFQAKLDFNNTDIEQARTRLALTKQIQDTIERTTFTSQFGKTGVNDDLAGKLGHVQDVAPKLLSTFSTALQGATRNLPSLLIQSFTGGGNIKGALQAVGTDFGEKLFGQSGAFVNFTKKATGSLSKVFGDTIGGAIGAAIPGIGALIGPAISGLGKLFGKVFQTEGKRTNDIRDAFQASFGPHGVGGTLDDLVKGFGRVGLGLSKVQQLLHAGNEKDFKKIVDEFNAALATQKTAFDKLNQAVDKYGFSLSELGPAFRAQKLGESAESLYEDFKLLQASGIDTATILQRMAGVVITTAEDGTQAVTDWGNGFGKLIHDAITTGTALPKELEPIVQQMIDLGLITKDDGTKYGSLEEAGVSFAGSLSDVIHDDLIPAIKALTDAITAGLSGAFDDASAKADGLLGRIRQLAGVHVSTGGDGGETGKAHRGALVTAAGLKFHQGGNVLPFVPRFHLGTDEVPAILQVGEAVINRRGVANIGTDAINAINHGYTPQAMVDASQLRATGTGGRSASSGGAKQPLVVELRLPNGSLLTRVVLDDIQHDKRGAKTELRRYMKVVTP